MGCMYYVRHGQSLWNIEYRVCGRTDIPLSVLGHQQAIEAGKEILARGIQADEILYSPLCRAKETARHISEITGIPMREEPRLIEKDYGRYEGTSSRAEEFLEAKEHFADRYDSGESSLQVVHRIYSLLDEIKAQSEEKTYILVSHNGVSRAVGSYFFSLSNREYARYGHGNASVTRYDFDHENVIQQHAD